jgi:hypothetical protein
VKSTRLAFAVWVVSPLIFPPTRFAKKGREMQPPEHLRWRRSPLRFIKSSARLFVTPAKLGERSYAAVLPFGELKGKSPSFLRPLCELGKPRQ